MLSLIIFFPFIYGLILFLFPKKALFLGSLVGSLIQVGLCCSLFYLFDSSNPDLQLAQAFPLVPFLGVHYFVGIDGISFWYVFLNTLLLPLVCLFSKDKQSPLYFFFLFSLCSLCSGAFLSFDSLLFYIFFELSLLPLFFMIYFYGGRKKIYASWKFLIYTFFASLFLLSSIISMMLINQDVTGVLSASLLDFYLLDFSFVEKQFFSTQSLLFLGMAFAFAVKTPLVPFHTWLPLAHVEAPSPASVYLAAVLLKLGAYGWIRFVLPLTPEASHFYAPTLLFLACLSLVHASALAFTRKDVKQLAAYSSIAHMAYIFLGLFAFNLIGLKGAYYQSLTHGISSAALFFLIGMIYKRSGTRDISQFGGLASFTPYLTFFFFITCLSSIALASYSRLCF